MVRIFLQKHKHKHLITRVHDSKFNTHISMVFDRCVHRNDLELILTGNYKIHYSIKHSKVLTESLIVLS